MGITFWYHLAGLAFAPFLLSEGIVSRCGRVLGRWCRRAGPSRETDSSAASHGRTDRWGDGLPADDTDLADRPIPASG